MMSQQNAFWSTIPGILTGIAAVVTAVGGLLAILFQAGIISFKEKVGTKSLPDRAEPTLAILAAPELKKPDCNTVLPISSISHGIAFSWQPVEGVSTYSVEVDCFGCSEYGRNWHSLAAGRPWHIRRGLGLRSPRYSSEVNKLIREAGGHAVRWRVWGVNHDGKEGARSDWCQISFSGSW